MTRDEALAILKQGNCAGVDTTSNGDIDLTMCYDGYSINGAKICAHVNLDGMFCARELRALLVIVETADKEQGKQHEPQASIGASAAR